MRSHRQILARALKEKGYTHVTIAKAMGWKSPASAGHKLTGRTDWSEGELGRMCQLAGMTIIELAAKSDDMPGFAHRKEVAEGAAILDGLSDEEFAVAMAMLRTLKGKNSA